MNINENIEKIDDSHVCGKHFKVYGTCVDVEEVELIKNNFNQRIKDDVVLLEGLDNLLEYFKFMEED